jgi:hypothetical protein
MESKHYFFIILEDKKYDIIHCHQRSKETVAFGLANLEGAWAMAEVKAKKLATGSNTSPIIETIPEEIVQLFFPHSKRQRAWVVSEKSS